MTHFSEFAAIDPLALILPMSIYIIVAEIKHPHEPNVGKLREALSTLSDAEKTFVLARAREFAASAKAVEAAIASR
jgi:hypothetical protein